MLKDGAERQSLSAKMASGSATPEEIRSLAGLSAAMGDFSMAADSLRPLAAADPAHLEGHDQQVAAMRVPAVDGDSTQIIFTAPPIDLQTGDYVELMVRQTSGQSLAIESTPTLAMTRAG